MQRVVSIGALATSGAARRQMPLRRSMGSAGVPSWTNITTSLANGSPVTTWGGAVQWALIAGTLAYLGVMGHKEGWY
jgi:hypothetical protein